MIGRRTIFRVAKFFVVVLGIWFAVGLLRADRVARDYFAWIHQGQTVVNVDTMTVPFIPPFWWVKIDGDVIQPGDTKPVYRSHMILWIEPITGWAIVAGAG